MAAPPAVMAEKTPSALLRSSPSGKTVVSRDSAAGDMSAPPRPCTSRAAMSRPWGSANPPASGPPTVDGCAANGQRP